METLDREATLDRLREHLRMESDRLAQMRAQVQLAEDYAALRPAPRFLGAGFVTGLLLGIPIWLLILNLLAAWK